MRWAGIALLALLLRPARALVVVNPVALRALSTTTSLAHHACTCAAVGRIAAPAATAVPPRCGCSRFPPTSSTTSHARESWRIPRASAAGATRRHRSGRRTAAARRGSSLSATIASWPAVEGTGSSSDGEARETGASARGSPVLIEQEGPAWTEVVWDEANERFVEANSLLGRSNSQRVRGAVGGLQLLVRHWFIPEDVTPDYYHFTFWRMFQRFVAGTINVFGTQALLLALGIKAKRLGAAAAMSWVLKDALGKFGRILWASKMGRRFDSDAKRWRFRSSLLYAAGNGLEIVTYVFPASFLVLAAMANSFKQMSMLTSSATRNTIYRSFARGENIGDITAKGEAQIAVVDLLGMLSGIGLCTLVGTSRQTIVAAYIILSLIDISAIYKEIRAVCFSVLNHERTHLLVRDYVTSGSDPSAMAQTPVAPRSSSPLAPLTSLLLTVPTAAQEVAPVAGKGDGGTGLGGGGGGRVGGRGGVAVGEASASLLQNKRDGEAGHAAAAAAAAAADTSAAPVAASTPVPLTVEEKEEAGKRLLSSPSTVSRRENIFLSSRLNTKVFKTWSQAGLSMDGVNDLLGIFGDERYMLAYTKKKRRRHEEKADERNGKKADTGSVAAKGIVSVILHRDATGAETVKSLLALEYFLEELDRAGFEVVGAPPPASLLPAGTRRSRGKGNAVGLNGDSAAATAGASTAAVAPGLLPKAFVGVDGLGRGSTAGTGEEARAPPLPNGRQEAAGVSSLGADEGEGGDSGDRRDPSPTELRRCLDAARRRANDGAPGFFAALEALGWSTQKFMFGNIKSRVEWRL